MTDFYQKAGFPRVIGTIDGCLIPIRGPDRDEHLYVCHKGFHAINVMAVCNAQLSFTHFVCRWHGSVHDSTVSIVVTYLCIWRVEEAGMHGFWGTEVIAYNHT